MVVRLVLLLALSVAFAAPARAQQDAGFAAFRAALWPDARAKGITRANFDLALRGVTPDPRVIAATQRQPEYGRPVGDYIGALASPRRIARGIEMAQRWEKTLAVAERAFKVERWILLALWGMETDYGAAKDRWDVFRSLATLAFVGYRHPYFRNELMVAMRIMQDGHIPRAKMVSSWAGAMGQMQFMPSTFTRFAVDLSGDRRPDIWTNLADALGSAANYLHKHGWQYGLPWGFEVVLPPNFDLMASRGSFADWTRRGVKRADGRPFPRDGAAILFFPAGATGPAFLVTPNFDALKAYNNSDAYAIAVGHLADRMRGDASIRAKWPAGDRPLSRDARVALQKRFAELGHTVNGFEGHIDFDLRDQIRIEQKRAGMAPDGNPTPPLLERLGVSPSR